MTKLWRPIVFGLAIIAGCSSERKLSHVEMRAPASSGAHGESMVSSLRSRIAKQSAFPAFCPPEVKELSALADDRVSFPPCPEALVPAFEAARSLLNLEESSAVEEMIGVQCHRNPRNGISETLVALMQEPPRKNPDPSRALRDPLRAALVSAQKMAEPLNQWVSNNGEMLLPEEQLLFLDRVVNRDSCRMPDQEIDQSYRVLRNLELLVRVQRDAEPQRHRLERLLAGMHQVMDRKIQEYFRR
jgi:hypothetical protein